MLKPNLSGFILSAVSTTTFAAGFQLQEHSASGLGRAFAGDASIAENAAGIGRNPALSTSFNNPTYSAGFTYIDPAVDAKGSTSLVDPGTGIILIPNISAAEEKDYASQAWVPNFYFLTPIDNRFSVGITINSHFGLRTDFDSSFGASDIADEARIETVNINPSIAYKVSDDFSVGFGLSFVYAEGELSTTTNQLNALALGTTLSGNETIAKVEGDSWGYSWNFGLLWEASQNVNIGFNYRGEVEIELEGEMESDLTAVGIPTGDASLNIDLPAGAELSLLYQITPTWTLSSSINWTDWSVFEALKVDFRNGGEFLLKEENYKDNWRYALAVTHTLSQSWTLRTGLAFDESPVQDEFRSLSIPDSDRYWYTLGVTYAYDDKISADIGYALLQGENVDIEETSRLGTRFVGETSGDANILSVSVNYTF